MKSDEEAAFFESLEVFGRELIRAESTFVLEHVIDVGAVKDPEQPAAEDGEMMSVDVDLKVEEAGSSVVGVEDVLRLVGIDVCDSASIQFGDQFEQFGEERVWDGSIA